jgi:hypothetical protein
VAYFNFFPFPSGGGMAKSFSNSKKIEFIHFNFPCGINEFFSRPEIAKNTYLPLPKNSHILTTTWWYGPP